ncbi:hypothetical protein PHAVU_003G036700 [Phaseolus vulgaris]|uniref:Uncharacterized protein n=1 Tax=Phaseolus vulgaris TaxID=3885 RepID=V7C7T5_PHAVU|nr:hypothetical protein PHAVU_003G036700g [Phaseolus vulgaris]ESW25448.1 hypothetical protein PHAVU_003G036700g [Phaseolus vulgaris]
MVLIKNTAACVLLLFLSAAWLSTARFNPKGVAANEIPEVKASVATRVTESGAVKSIATIDEEKLKKRSGKVVMSKYGKVKFSSIAEGKGSAPSTFAFTADYHRPVHHPPKNN